MIFANGLVMDEDFKLKHLDIQIAGRKIIKIAEKIEDVDSVLDMSGKYILPGFVDTHIHGAYGVRISDKNPCLYQVTQFEATQGVTSIAITTAASEFNDILRQIEVAVNASKETKGAKIAGIHAEGPFISKQYKGAMNGDNIINPDKEKLDTMIAHAEGLLKIITVAPEAEGASDFIRYSADCGITVSMGHSNATYDETMAAVRAGASQTTHTFNAMRAFNHREPGIVGAALTCNGIKCELICDYVHLHPVAVELVYRMKGADSINMISDSGHAAGMNVTEFMVDGLMRYVKDGVVRLADGTIAGSAKTMLDGVKNLAASGVPLEDISKMASLNGAKSLKMEHLIGSISVGKSADFAVLDKNYDVNCTFVDGTCVYTKNNR